MKTKTSKKVKRPKKYYRQIGDKLEKIESYMTEIQRYIDEIHQISHRLYEIDV